MHPGRTNVNKFLIEAQQCRPELGGDFSMLVSDLVRSCKAVARLVAHGALAGLSSDGEGATPASLEMMANSIFLDHCEWGGHLSAISSGVMEGINPTGKKTSRGRFLLVLEPLDGTTNIDINLSVGSIFSILRCPEPDAPTDVENFLQSGMAQVAAGYALYGSSTMLVLTIGQGTHGFTLDREIGEFLLTHPHLRIPDETSNFAINASNERFWEPPVRRFVEECREGRTGIRGKDFNMRWAGTMVADIHRLLMRGGVFLYPSDTRDPTQPGRLSLLHKANPMAMIVEQAGGLATTGYERIGTIRPACLHQQTPVILGSRQEIERIERYHTEHLNGEDKPFSSPLFGTRSLFRIE